MFKCLILKKIKANNDSLWKMLISTYLAPRNVVPVDKKFRGKFSKSFEQRSANCGFYLTVSHPRNDPVKLFLVCKIIIC